MCRTANTDVSRNMPSLNPDQDQVPVTLASDHSADITSETSESHMQDASSLTGARNGAKLVMSRTFRSRHEDRAHVVVVFEIRNVG
jgi:hypothetical protein